MHRRICPSFLIFIALFLTNAIRADETRHTLSFNSDWKFIKSDVPDAKNANFDDASWTTVSCPHTYNDIDTFDDFSLAGHRGEQNQFGGRTWYRKTFNAPDSWRGKKIYIEFEAVRQVAEVYLNGEFLGASKTGFLPFGFDLTPHLKIGQTNTIAVMCDNRFMKDPPENARGGSNRATSRPATKPARDLNLAPAASGTLAELSAKVNSGIPESVDEIQADQIPWNNPHWHPAHGGIYRNVYLHVVDPLHVSLPLYSFLQTAGPYVYSSEISDKSATVHFELPIQNDRKTAEKFDVVAKILDRDGKEIATLDPKIKTLAVQEIPAGEKQTLEFSAKIENPQLWEPAYPCLYRIVATVRAGGKDVDAVEIPFGMRTLKFDADTGFWINGNHLKLHGWGQKPTDEWPGLGAAQPDWLHWFTLNLMKQAGGNWVRWGHCSGSPAMIKASDRLGIMVEQPGLDGESDTRGAAWKIRAAGFRDMIIYYRNHPSIAIWEAGNQKVTREHAKELRNIADQYDPHNDRAFAFRRSDKVVAEFETAHIGTEGGREMKDLPVIEGEYDREESPRRVWDDQSPPNFGYPEAAGMTYQLTSEQYAINQVEQWVKKCGGENHSGGANWIFSDSTSGGRVPAEVARASGEVDGVRLPKEAYYVCQAMFSSEPKVHIIGHWSYPEGRSKPIYAASNADEVELFVNGTSVGRVKPTNRYLFTFPEAKFAPGDLKAVAYIDGKEVATDSVKTAGAPAALRLSAITGPGGLRAHGADVALIDAEVVDANGQRCPTFEDRIDFTCTGPAIWRGGYNSGKPGSTNKNYLNLECGINRVAIRSTETAGKIVVNATVKGLKPASIEITSVPVSIRDGASDELPQLPPQGSLTKPTHQSIVHDITTPAARPALADGKLIAGFSYSGPKGGASIKPLTESAKIYSDRNTTFKDLPASLKDKQAEYLQVPNADATYSALDLFKFSATAELDI
jgi:beta-galactosidase